MSGLTKDTLYLYLFAGFSYSSLLHRMGDIQEKIEPLWSYALAVVGWPVIALTEIAMTLGIIT